MENSVLSQGVIVEEGASVSYSVLLPGVRVERGAQVRYAILGEPAARVAADLGLSVNALYQIKNRLTERLAAEVRALEAEDGAAPR